MRAREITEITEAEPIKPVKPQKPSKPLTPAQSRTRADKISKAQAKLSDLQAQSAIKINAARRKITGI